MYYMHAEYTWRVRAISCCHHASMAPSFTPVLLQVDRDASIIHGAPQKNGSLLCPSLIGWALSDDARLTSDVCLTTFVAYFGPKSRTERPYLDLDFLPCQ